MTASAKPLFRAMRGRAAGAVPPDGAAAAVRRADDFYPTAQPEPIRALMAREWDVLSRLGRVWEPACGDGALVREMRAAGLDCVASDLRDRGCPDATVGDFLATTASPAPAIITNPPYDLINARDGHGRWLRHTLDLPGWTYCALLLSWDWPAAVANGLGAMLDREPFAYSYLCRWKIDFTGDGSPPQRNAWFVWRRDLPRGEPRFRWLNRDDVRQGQLFGRDG